jgi:hypothetical protein
LELIYIRKTDGEFHGGIMKTPDFGRADDTLRGG